MCVRRTCRRFPRRRPKFRAKLTRAAELIEWAAACLEFKDETDLAGRRWWLCQTGSHPLSAAGGRHADRSAPQGRGLAEFARAATAEQTRSQAEYGKEVISLPKRADHRQGWQTAEMVLYGKKVTKTYKTFLATWPPAGGVIRVVLVKEADGWLAFFGSDPNATPAEILEMVADRNSLEQTFKDEKKLWSARPTTVAEF